MTTNLLLSSTEMTPQVMQNLQDRGLIIRLNSRWACSRSWRERI